MRTLSTFFSIALAIFFLVLSWIVADFAAAFILICIMITEGMSP